MFDMREDGEADSSKLARMMQNLGVFISVKPKVKQTNKVQLFPPFIHFLFEIKKEIKCTSFKC